MDEISLKKRNFAQTQLFKHNQTQHTVELKSGTSLRSGKYRIERVLGQGSFGITYLATARFTTADSSLGPMEVEAKVTIKEFFMSDINDRAADGSTVGGSCGTVFTNYRRRFRKEAENLSRLSHPNIVKVYDVFDENDTTYYVMEFIDGETLDAYINRKGTIPSAEAVEIMESVGSALSYMHSQKMLHLDVKPKNVMRRREDGSYFLIDFGLSKFFTPNGVPETSTTIGLGTPGYAPIEQSNFRQDGSFPATLDVYALGATLYKMLTGHRPPEASDVLNNGLNPNLFADKGLVAITSKAMAPIKKDRYPSVEAFVNALGGSVPESEKTSFSAADSHPHSRHETETSRHQHKSRERRENTPAQTASRGSVISVLFRKFKQLGWFGKLFVTLFTIFSGYLFIGGIINISDLSKNMGLETKITFCSSLAITTILCKVLSRFPKIATQKWLLYVGIFFYFVTYYNLCVKLLGSFMYWAIDQCILILLIQLWYLSPDNNTVSNPTSSKSA